MDIKSPIVSVLALGLLIQGCMLDEITKVAKTGSKSYAVVKNANSLGILADTRKIKAETSKDFVRATEKLIASQSLKFQPALIEKSLEAKVSLASNTWWSGFQMGISIVLAILGLVSIIKYLFGVYKPKPKTKSETF